MAVAPDHVAVTPNYTPGWPHGRPKAVLIHSTRSGQRHFTDAQERSATINWFAKRHANASSHWLVTASGEKIRFVADEHRSWHAGFHNDWSRGIELTQPTIDRPYEDGHYEGLAIICREYVAMGVPIIHLVRFANGAQGFAGHDESEQGMSVGKSDPGPGFDWARFLNMLGEDSDMKPYLVREQGQPYIWITDNVERTYLRDFAHAQALGIDLQVKVVPAGTLDSVARAG